MTPADPIRPAITLPPEAGADEAKDFARGLEVLARLARRVAELASEAEKGSTR